MSRRNTQKVSHLLAADLRRQILRGELEEGQRLAPEPELTEQWQVSRESLREAIRILESQSLVEIRRGRHGGVVIRQPGLDAVATYVGLLLQSRNTTLDELVEARSVVELSAAQQVGDGTTGPELDRLSSLHDIERAVTEPLAFVAAVVAFDQAVIDLSGNQSLGVIAGVFREIHAGHVYAVIGDADERSAAKTAQAVVGCHAAFLAAVRQRDSASAGEAWREYLTTTRRTSGGERRGEALDLTPLWRARARATDGLPAPRRAIAVATEIRVRIARGDLSDGDRLPPLVEVAKEHGVSRPTLREALRILETERLLDIRMGGRDGALVCAPSTQVAAQLAGIVLQARRTTLGDFQRTLRFIEPPTIALIAARITPDAITALREHEAELAQHLPHAAEFVHALWHAWALAFSATDNPALTLVAEILHWVRVAVEANLAAEARKAPSVEASNRRALELYSRLVTALERRDALGAHDACAAFLDASAPFVQGFELGDRLVIDLID